MVKSRGYDGESGYSDDLEREQEPLSRYDELVQMESAPALPDDDLIFHIPPSLQDGYHDLGISLTPTTKGDSLQLSTSLQSIVRQDLQEHDIALINSVSRDAEKKLLAGEITFDDGYRVDLSTLAFLTRDQLESVKKYQQSQRETQYDDQDFERFRQEACDILDEALEIVQGKKRSEIDFVAEVLQEIEAELSPEEHALFEEYTSKRSKEIITGFEWSYLYNILGKIAKSDEAHFLEEAISNEELRHSIIPDLIEILKEQFPRLPKNNYDFLFAEVDKLLAHPNGWEDYYNSLQDTFIYPTNDHQIWEKKMENPGTLLIMSGVNTRTKVRGILFNYVGSRNSVFYDFPSPLVDSGFRFTDNPDITLTFPDGRIRRLNMMVPHLWSVGLDEMGGSGDQVYMTSSEMEELLAMMESGPDPNQRFSDGDRALLKDHILREMRGENSADE